MFGETVIENDDLILTLYFEDEASHTLVTSKSRDAAALVQEWMIPHKPFVPEDE